jgi:SAM-dependent methyltransferase
MTIFTFEHEPTFAELWDACVTATYSGQVSLVQDIKKLFNELNIAKDSKIVDVCAGPGFPSLEFIREGYDVTCTDGTEDEVELFNKKAKKIGLSETCKKIFWKDLPRVFDANTFDFLFCRGNSFIYAAGGWNVEQDVDAKKSLATYETTLRIFFNLLKPGGWAYIDKFEDTETSSRETIAQVSIAGGKSEDLIFWRERNSEKKIRRAAMVLKTTEGEKGLPNITYDLSEQELVSLMQKVGFKNIQRKEIIGEAHYIVFIAQKSI